MTLSTSVRILYSLLLISALPVQAQNAPAPEDVSSSSILPFKFSRDISKKGFFTKEIEAALMNDEIDVAVHSHKDLETQEHPRLIVAAVSESGNTLYSIETTC